jgi:uncharacterized protein
MSLITANQPDGTPTWIDLGIPDLDRAMAFYGTVFGWEFDVGPAEFGRYTMCLLRGEPVAAMMPNHEEGATRFWWNVYLATDSCDRTAERIAAAGGTLVIEPMDAMEHGRMAIARDPTGAQFGLWQGRKHVGARIVNEPGSLVRNDLVTPDPGPARAFYTAVFDFTLDGNEDMPDYDFTFLRRPSGRSRGRRDNGGSGRGAFGVEHHVRGRRHRRRGGRGDACGGQVRRDPGHALRPVRHDHRPVRRGFLDHRPAGGRGWADSSDVNRARSTFPPLTTTPMR